MRRRPRRFSSRSRSALPTSSAVSSWGRRWLPDSIWGYFEMGTSMAPLPPSFLQHLAHLEAAYLRETDPIRQSGFSGGAERWRAERSPILLAIPESGTVLDVGCANGYLLECL